jgi:hypothetical protein
VLDEAGLATRDARPRPRQTEARRRHRAGGHPGTRRGSRRHGPHLDREAVPCRVRMRLAHADRMALAQPAIDPHWPAHCRITGCQVVRDMTLFDNRSPSILVLRRKGRTFTDAGGACRAVIGCALAGGTGDCDRPQVTAGLPTSRARSPRGRSASRFAQEFRQLGKGVDAVLEYR